MKPSIGRIVHFVDNFLKHNAAVVTAVEGDTVDLEIFGNVVNRFRYSIAEQKGERVVGDTWHWPERVD